MTTPAKQQHIVTGFGNVSQRQQINFATDQGLGWVCGIQIIGGRNGSYITDLSLNIPYIRSSAGASQTARMMMFTGEVPADISPFQVSFQDAASTGIFPVLSASVFPGVVLMERFPQPRSFANGFTYDTLTRVQFSIDDVIFVQPGQTVSVVGMPLQQKYINDITEQLMSLNVWGYDVSDAQALADLAQPTLRSLPPGVMRGAR